MVETEGAAPFCRAGAEVVASRRSSWCSQRTQRLATAAMTTFFGFAPLEHAVGQFGPTPFQSIDQAMCQFHQHRAHPAQIFLARAICRSAGQAEEIGKKRSGSAD